MDAQAQEVADVMDTNSVEFWKERAERLEQAFFHHKRVQPAPQPAVVALIGATVRIFDFCVSVALYEYPGWKAKTVLQYVPYFVLLRTPGKHDYSIALRCGGISVGSRITLGR